MSACLTGKKLYIYTCMCVCVCVCVCIYISTDLIQECFITKTELQITVGRDFVKSL